MAASWWEGCGRRVRLGRSVPGMKLKRWLLILAGLFVGIFLGIWFLLLRPQSVASTAARRLPPVVGAPVPDFTLPRLDGTKQALHALRGKPVVINFWATWCLPCKEEMPLLERYAQKYPDQFIVLGINSAEEEQVVKNYVQSLGITFPILLDQSGSVTESYYVRNFPITFFVDAQGMLRGQHLGTLDETALVKYLQTIGIKP